MTTKSKAPIGSKANIIPIRATNLATGELTDLSIPAPKSRRHTVTGYYSFAPGAWRRLRVTELEGNLIHLLLEHTDSRRTGSTYMSQREMAEELHSSIGYIQRRLTLLRRRGIVIREGQGRYRVNSHIGFQGSRSAWEYAWVADREPDWTGTKPKLEVL